MDNLEVIPIFYLPHSGQVYEPLTLPSSSSTLGCWDMTTLLQYKVVRYVNFGFLSVSADCLLSAVCLLFFNKPLRGFWHWNCSKQWCLEWKLRIWMCQLFIYFQLFVYISTETTQRLLILKIPKAKMLIMTHYSNIEAQSWFFLH